MKLQATLRNEKTFSWINFKHVFVAEFITHFKLKKPAQL